MGFSPSRALQAQAEGKALPAHPAFMGRTPVSVYSPGANRQDAVISQREAARHADAYGGREAIDHVYDCIGLYSDAVSTAPYILSKPDGTKLVPRKTKLTPPDFEVGPADLYTLLDKPNPFQLYDEVMALLVIDLLLVGNAYWYKWQTGASGKPLALYRLAPSHVKIVPGPYGPKSYKYQPPGVREPLEIQPENIIHFRRPNPHSAFYGMGVVQGAGRSMDLELAITDTMASYYENRADPSMIVQSERRVPRDVFNKLRAQLRGRASGTRNAGEMLVLEAGLKASSLSPNARDALFEELSRMSRDRIYSKFRASPMLFGLMDQAAGSNKVSDARREFDNAALRPFTTKLSKQITSAVADLWNVNYEIDHEEILPAEDAIKVAESVSKAPGMKVRDVRRAYRQFGYEESTGDKDIDEMVLNLPGENMDENGQGVNGGPGLADMPIGSEAGRPAKRENTAAITKSSPSQASAQARSPQGKALDALAALEKAVEGKAGPVSTPAPDNSLPGEIRPDDPFSKIRQTDIDRTTTDIAVALRDATSQLERDLLDHVEGKALKTSDLVGRMRRSDAWKTFESRVRDILSDGVARSVSSGVMHSGMTPDEEIDYDDVAQDIINRPDGVRKIVKTLKDRVAKRISDARDANAERGDFEAVVRSTIAEWNENQAVAIADSEAVEGYNEGTLKAAELSGITDFYVIEEDDAPDDACQEARGQVWDLKTARANRKEHPRCRRAFIPLTADAVA